MRNTFKRFGGLALVGGILASCGGEPTIDDVIICQQINNATYVSEDLFDVQRSAVKGHWRVDLKDYTLSSFQSDFVLSGSYACQDGEVIADLQNSGTKKMVFSKDYQTLEFNPLEDKPITYKRVPQPNTAGKDCETVSGKTFQTKNLATNDESAQLLPGNYFEHMSFGKEGELQYTIGGDAIATGRYDCELGELTLYANDMQFANVDVAKDGKRIVVNRQEGQLNYFLQEQTFCTEQFAPVCAIKPENIQCLVAPCPTGYHKTYSNSCYAEQDEAKELFPSDCGAQEDQPYFEPVACTKEYAPVCGGVTTREPCDSVPCPAIVHETFGNQCMLNAAGAINLFKDVCGKLEGEPVTERKDVVCPAVYLPVCAKNETDIRCLTAPCPTHDYKTYGNACEAGGNLATIVKNEECGSLENVWAFGGQPPIQMVEGLPTVLNPAAPTEARIDEDVLTVSLTYSACGPLHHELLISSTFLESNPVQADLVFRPVLTEFCKAVAQEATFTYDLLPLKHEYLNAYQAKSGKIILRGLGVTYEF